MSDLTFNKIAGGVLAAGLTIFALREVTTAMFSVEPPEKMGYAIEVPEEVAGVAAGPVELPPDWGAVLPVANIDAGKAVAAKCAACHSFEAGGPNGTGPGLFGTMGKKPGTHAGYSYSGAMVEYGNQNPAWDFQHMDDFLKAPGKTVAGTKMTFVGLRSQEDRINIIAYLHSLGSTLTIPAPNPVAAPAADTAATDAAGAEAAPAEGEAATPAAE